MSELSLISHTQIKFFLKNTFSFRVLPVTPSPHHLSPNLHRLFPYLITQKPLSLPVWFAPICCRLSLSVGLFALSYANDVPALRKEAAYPFTSGLNTFMYA